MDAAHNLASWLTGNESLDSAERLRMGGKWTEAV